MTERFGLIMEFNEKLQELRKKKGLTQEELAEALFVSRTAVSKWESGRGYPNIESLKAISRFFSVTVDELLSADEIIQLAEADGEVKKKSFRDLICGLIDISSAMLIFLPFFAERAGGGVLAVSLLELRKVASYLSVVFYALIGLQAAFGVLTLALQGFGGLFWNRSKAMVSLSLSAALVLIFILSMQVYAACFAFILLIIKAVAVFKSR